MLWWSFVEPCSQGGAVYFYCVVCWGLLWIDRLYPPHSLFLRFQSSNSMPFVVCVLFVVCQWFIRIHQCLRSSSNGWHLERSEDGNQTGRMLGKLVTRRTHTNYWTYSKELQIRCHYGCTMYNSMASEQYENSNKVARALHHGQTLCVCNIIISFILDNFI